jgi:small-conductance mechanosensitive channel
VDEHPELLHNRLWRIAVRTLRVGYVGLVVALAGLVALAFGSTRWIVASGVIIWLATVPVTLTGLLLARHELREPRPIHDSVHQL